LLFLVSAFLGSDSPQVGKTQIKKSRVYSKNSIVRHYSNRSRIRTTLNFNDIFFHVPKEKGEQLLVCFWSFWTCRAANKLKPFHIFSYLILWSRKF